MNRTDRTLIIIALLVLLLVLGTFYQFDNWFGSRPLQRGETVAYIAKARGDYRVKFKDQLYWQKARVDDQLTYDDAIFSGDNSGVDIKIGDSDLTLNANSLVVLRKQDMFNALDLSYGKLTGALAKNDKLYIKSGDENILLEGDQASQVSISKSGGKMSVRVHSGSARVIRNSREVKVTPDRPLEVAVEPPASTLQMEFPKRTYFYTADVRKMTYFQWRYQNDQLIGPSDAFTLEISPTPTFETLQQREAILGVNHMEIPILAPAQTLYARLRDEVGNTSEQIELHILPPKPPLIRSPVEGQEWITAPESHLARVPIALSEVPNQARVWVQVARDPEFRNLEMNKATTVAEFLPDLSANEYYVRAKSVYDEDKIQSAWSPTVHFSVRDPLDLLKLANQGLPYKIIIPNEKYPAHLYRASDEKVQNFVSAIQPLPQFFKTYQIKGYDLIVSRYPELKSERKMEGPAFPHEWIYPGKMDLQYRIEAAGQAKVRNFHRVEIELEPPNELWSNAKGELNWSPLLFARSYETELRDSSGQVRRWTSQQPRTMAQNLRPEVGYGFRVRALGRKNRPISAWSNWSKFKSAPAEPVYLEEAPKLAENDESREPAQAGQNTFRQTLNEKSSFLHKIGAWLWGGSGYNFVFVKQTVANTADIEYKNTKGPNSYIEAGFMDLGGVGALFSYKRTPGEVRIDNYPVNQRNFIWETSTAELLWKTPWRPRPFARPVLWAWRAGIQYHQFPFLFVGPRHTLIQAQNNLTTASLGFYSETEGRWRYHWSMRYQMPFKSSSEGGNSFEVKPLVAFDGLLGTSYNLTDNWKTGLFWYGQLHNYKFNYTSSTQSNSGSQSLFYSNMELRLGYEF